MRRTQSYWEGKALLSQAWLSAPLTVAIVFIVKLALLRSFVLATMSLGLAVIRTDCAKFEESVEVLRSMPVEIATVASRLVNNSIDHTVKGLLHMLANSLSILECLLWFAFEMTIGSYACLTISAVNIGANEALNATKLVVKEANQTVKSIEKELQHGLSKLSSFVNGAIGLVNTVDDFISGGDEDIRNVNLTISKLGNWSIPSSINKDLESFRGKIVTYDETKKIVKKAIDTPFNALRGEIANFSGTNTSISFSPLTSSKDSTFPACDISKVEAIFEKMHHRVNIVTGALYALCAVALIAGILCNTYRARSHWQRLIAFASSMTRPICEPEASRRDAIDRNVERILTGLEDEWWKRYLLSRIPQNYRPVARYLFSAQLTTVLVFGLAGIAISAMELIVLSTLTESLKELGALEKDLESETRSMAASIFHQWQTQTNDEIGAVERNLNINLLGWIHRGSKTVNSTLASFSTGLNKEIGSLFNGTFIQASLQAATKCVLENKIQDAEKGLTWLYNHSTITLPRVNETLLGTKGAHGVTSISSTVAHFKSEASNIIDQALAQERHQINVQFLVSGTFISIWAAYAVATIVLFLATRVNRTNSAKHFHQPQFSNTLNTSGIQRKHRPTPLATVDLASQGVTQSPCQSASSRATFNGGGDRDTALFDGPARPVGFSSVASPRQGIVSRINTPRTPLPAFAGRQKFSI